MYNYIEINDLQDEQFMLVSKLKQLGFLRTRFYDSLPTSVAKQKDWQLTFPCGVIPLPGHGIFLQGDTSSKRERRMGSLGQINHQQWYNGGFCSCRFGVGWGRPKGFWRLGFSSLVVFILNYGTNWNNMFSSEKMGIRKMSSLVWYVYGIYIYMSYF